MINVEEISKEELLKLKDKYIFHGSPALFDVCKPHKAKCDTGKKENNQFAIYGSSKLTFAILFTFEKLPKSKYKWSANTADDGSCYALLEEGTYIDENAFGYIYCFNKNKFEPTAPGSHQQVCKQQLTPEKIFKVYYKQFTELFQQGANETAGV